MHQASTPMTRAKSNKFAHSNYIVYKMWRMRLISILFLMVFLRENALHDIDTHYNVQIQIYKSDLSAEHGYGDYNFRFDWRHRTLCNTRGTQKNQQPTPRAFFFVPLTQNEQRAWCQTRGFTAPYYSYLSPLNCNCGLFPLMSQFY